MYGLINAALKEFVVTTYGPDAWQRIADASAAGVTSFNKMDPYPDELTFAMVASGSQISGVPADELIDKFGEFWVWYTDQQGYGPLFEIAGDSLRDFLLSLNTLHARVGRSFPKLQPPSFRFDQLSPRSLRMHYVTQRKGLCPMVPGILRGLSLRFKTELQVTKEVCARNGAPHCQFILVFPEVGV